MTPVVSAKVVHLGKGAWSLVDFSPGDAELVCMDLRPSDELDIAAATTLPAAVAVAIGARRSKPCYTVLCDGQPAAVLGIDPAADGVGSCWLIGSMRFDRAMRSGLARLTAPWFRFFTRDYREVFNFVPLANEADLRWLDHLGFERGRVVVDYRGLGHDCVEVRRNLP